MSTEPLECVREGDTGSEGPPAAIPNHMGHVKVDLPYRISVEHCYSRLVPLRSSPPPCTISQAASFPTSVLFPDRVSNKGRSRSRYSKKSYCISTNFKCSRIQCESSDSDTESADEGDRLVDVVTADPIPDLPYDERKVISVMSECSRHINLVKVPAENSDFLLLKAIQDASYHRKILLQQLVDIIQAEHLARLACYNVSHEPIKRRLTTDKAARQFRKAMTDVGWDFKMTRYCHETLLQVLNADLLPIYMDILQVLKAICPVLIENMIHSSISLVGNEAFGLLLKRPWNPVIGLPTVEKQVKFDSAPLFVSLPYSTTGLGGRRWRMLQNNLSIIGKVYPVMIPERLTDIGHGYSLEEIAQQIMLISLVRVQELQVQYPARPIVLFGFSIAGRIAAKVAEVEPVSCIISLGLPAVSMTHKWRVEDDPFNDCKTPTVFVTGSESDICSVEFIEALRSRMSCPTSLVVVGGGDDLLRLSADDKAAETICQSIVDRCILDKIQEFLVYNLPCSYPDDQVRLVRKRKCSHTDDIGSTFLTPVVSQSPIRLTSPIEDSPNPPDSKNINLNNSNPLQRPASRSGTPSPAFLSQKISSVGTKFPKVGRPRSRSTTSDISHKRATLRLRSVSSDQTNRKTQSTKTANILLNLNSNNSNNNTSPPGILSIPQATCIRPLPITPPRNPFEDIKTFNLNPKTLKQLYMGK